MTMVAAGTLLFLATAAVALVACSERRASDVAPPPRVGLAPTSRVVDPVEPGPTVKIDPSKLGPALKVDVEDSHACAVLASGRVACWGELHGMLQPLVTTPELVQGVADAVEVSGACARLRAGAIACWADDLVAKPIAGTEGALGLVAGSEPCFITAQHTVACLDGDKRPVPVVGLVDVAAARRFGRESWCYVKTEGRIECQGEVASQLGKLPDVRDAIGIADVDQGRSFACAVRKGGQLVCFSASPDALAPAPKAADQLFALGMFDCLRSGGAVRCRERGSEAWREMALGGAASDLSCRSRTCCAVVNGAIACWGDNGRGHLGDGMAAFARDPVRVEGLPPVARLAAGHNMTFALARNGDVYAWGGIGNGKRVPTRVGGNGEIVASGDVTAAVASLRLVRLYGHEEDRRQDAPHAGFRWRGETLPELPADVRSLAVETPHRVCAALVDGTVRCLDSDDDAPHWTPIAGMVDVLELEGPCGVTRTGTLVCAPLSDHDSSPRGLRAQVFAGITTAKHSASNYVELEGGHIVSVEHYDNGKRSQVVPQPALRGIASIRSGGFGWSPSCGIAAGRVTCWARGGRPVALALEAVEVTAGNRHACAVDASGSVWCWGDDREGQLGRGRVFYRAEPGRVVEIGPLREKDER